MADPQLRLFKNNCDYNSSDMSDNKEGSAKSEDDSP